jgi:hypothetical protein
MLPSFSGLRNKTNEAESRNLVYLFDSEDEVKFLFEISVNSCNIKLRHILEDPVHCILLGSSKKRMIYFKISVFCDETSCNLWKCNRNFGTIAPCLSWWLIACHIFLP